MSACPGKTTQGTLRLTQAGLAVVQVAALTVGPEHNTHFDNLFKVCMNMLVSIIPQSTDIPKAYTSATSADDQDFVQNLALFLTAFFKVGHMPTSSNRAMQHLIGAVSPVAQCGVTHSHVLCSVNAVLPLFSDPEHILVPQTFLVSLTELGPRRPLAPRC